MHGTRSILFLILLEYRSSPPRRLLDLQRLPRSIMTNSGLRMHDHAFCPLAVPPTKRIIEANHTRRHGKPHSYISVLGSVLVVEEFPLSQPHLSETEKPSAKPRFWAGRRSFTCIWWHSLRVGRGRLESYMYCCNARPDVIEG